MNHAERDTIFIKERTLKFPAKKEAGCKQRTWRAEVLFLKQSIHYELVLFSII
jgi:hypothetical protein